MREGKGRRRGDREGSPGNTGGWPSGERLPRSARGQRCRAWCSAAGEGRQDMPHAAWGPLGSSPSDQHAQARSGSMRVGLCVWSNTPGGTAPEPAARVPCARRSVRLARAPVAYGRRHCTPSLGQAAQGEPRVSVGLCLAWELRLRQRHQDFAGLRRGATAGHGCSVMQNNLLQHGQQDAHTKWDAEMCLFEALPSDPGHRALLLRPRHGCLLRPARRDAHVHAHTANEWHTYVTQQ